MHALSLTLPFTHTGTLDLIQHSLQEKQLQSQGSEKETEIDTINPLEIQQEYHFLFFVQQFKHPENMLN